MACVPFVKLVVEGAELSGGVLHDERGGNVLFENDGHGKFKEEGRSLNLKIYRRVFLKFPWIRQTPFPPPSTFPPCELRAGLSASSSAVSGVVAW